MSLSILRAGLQLCVHGREEGEGRECESGCGRVCVCVRREREAQGG